MNATVSLLANGDFEVARSKHFNGGFRVFWAAGGEPVFRDHTGLIRPIHVIRLRRVIATLHRMANETRNTTERTRLCLIMAEAREALNDTMLWRYAARGLAGEAA